MRFRSLARFTNRAAGAIVLLTGAQAMAQEEVLQELYGSGVHAYFAQDYAQAHEYLTEAIGGGTKDPRSYYFRGLAYIKLGRAEEAKMDFEKGAKLESGNVNRLYSVSKSLERIQGKSRLGLERHRATARLAALQKAEQQQTERAQQR